MRVGALTTGAAPRADPLGGVWNIVPTPFAPSGELDIASVRRLAEFVIGTGIDGLTILGVMGEAHDR